MGLSNGAVKETTIRRHREVSNSFVLDQDHRIDRYRYLPSRFNSFIRENMFCSFE